MAFVTILCSLFAVGSRPTRRRARRSPASSNGWPPRASSTPEDAAATRAIYDDARGEGRSGSRARARSSSAGSSRTSRAWPRAAPFEQPVAAPRAVPDAAAQRRVLERAAAAGRRRAGRASPAPSCVFQFYPGHGLQIQWLGTFGKLNGYWSGGKRYDARAGALLDEAMPLATERAGGLAWEYLFPFDGQDAAVGQLARPGHGPAGDGALGDAAAAPGRDLPDRAARARHLPDRAAARACACASGDGAHYLQYSGLPRLFDPQRLRPVARRPLRLRRADRRRRPRARCSTPATSPRARRSRPSTPAPGRCTRAARSRRSPTSATTRCCATSSPSCASARRRSQYCSADQHFTEYLTAPPVGRGPAAHAASPRSRASCASSSRRSRASALRSRAGRRCRDDQPGRARPRDEDAGLDGAEEDPATTRSR